MREPDYQKRVIKDIALRRGLSEDVVRKIVYSQYKFANHCIREKEPFRISFWGRWFIRRGREKHVNRQE